MLRRNDTLNNDHYAVLVAEDITSRLLNVIGLFNGFIPLIALQMSALRFGFLQGWGPNEIGKGKNLHRFKGVRLLNESGVYVLCRDRIPFTG